MTTFVVTRPAIKDIKYMRWHIGCNLVEWAPINTGNCHVTYNVQYENQTGIVGIISEIDDATHAWFTNLYPDGIAIKMWAEYNGNIGAKSSTIPLMDKSCDRQVNAFL